MSAAGLSEDLAALVDELAENEEERAVMGRAVQLLALSAAEAEPAPDLRERVLLRAARPEQRAAFAANGFFFARGQELGWTPIAEGIDLKVLYQDSETGARTLVVRMAPGRHFPPHAHAAIEDLYLVEGEAWVAGVPLRAGDYCRAPAGSEHNDVRSGPSGALAVVVSR